MISSTFSCPTGLLSLLLRRQHDTIFHRYGNDVTTTTPVSRFQFELQLQIAEDYSNDGWYYYGQHHTDQQHQPQEEIEDQEERKEEIDTCYSKSIELLSHSLKIREQLLGTYHVLTGKSYYKIAMVFLALSTKRQHECITYEHPRAYDRRTTTTTTASTAHWLFRYSWRIFYNLYGPSHKLTILSVRFMRVSLVMMKFPYKAAQHYCTILHQSIQLEEEGDRTLRRRKRRTNRDSGNDDDDSVSSSSSSSSNNNDDNQTIDVAIEYYTKAIHLLQDDLVILGMEGPDKAELFAKVGHCYVQRHRNFTWQYRLGSHRHLDAICTTIWGEAPCTLCHQLLHCKHSLLIIVQEEEKNHDENLDSRYYNDLMIAFDMYHHAVDIYKGTFGDDHPATIRTIDKIKEIYPLFNTTYQSEGWLLRRQWCRFCENVECWFHRLLWK